MCFALLSFSVGCKDDFQKGYDAYLKGDYLTAYKSIYYKIYLKKTHSSIK